MNFLISRHAFCLIFGLIARWPLRTKIFRFRLFVAAWRGSLKLDNLSG
jgi:hypothetical protein